MIFVSSALRRIATASALSLALGGCAASRAPTATGGVVLEEHALAIARGRNIVRPLVRRGSGVAVAVGLDGRLVWAEGFGRTSRDGGSPVSPDAPFRAYSLMKQVTAVLALQSAARREVNLRAAVREALPDLPAHYSDVTLQQLLTHTGGVRHYRDSAESRIDDHCVTAREALPRFIGDPLVHRPGERESYSTWGFVLASAVLEAASGMPFDALVRSRIIAPTGMTSTALEGTPDVADHVAFYDVDARGEVRESPPIDNSCKMGGGGFLMSAADLVRFHNAVLRGDVVPLPMVRQMLGARTTLDAGGSGPGGEAVSHIDLDSRVSIVLFSNTSGLEQRLALERARELLVAVFR